MLLTPLRRKLHPKRRFYTAGVDGVGERQSRRGRARHRLLAVARRAKCAETIDADAFSFKAVVSNTPWRTLASTRSAVELVLVRGALFRQALSAGAPSHPSRLTQIAVFSLHHHLPRIVCIGVVLIGIIRLSARPETAPDFPFAVTSAIAAAAAAVVSITFAILRRP